MMIRAAEEADAPLMGRFSVETWLTAHNGQVPDGQWQARQVWQGQGVGKMLLQTAVRHLAQQGKNKLVIGCLEANTPACHFYEACGGQKVGEVETEDEGFPELQRIYGWEDSSIIYVDNAHRK